MKLHASSRCAAGNDLRLALRRRMLDPHIQTAPPDRIAQPPLLIAGEHHKRNALGLNSPKLRNRELPGGKNLQQQSLKPFIYLVEFVNQQHARLLAFERAHQRTRPKEIAPLEVGLQLAPAPALSVPLRELHVKPLKALVEAPDGLVLSDPAVALQPLDMRPGRLRNRDRELRFAAARRPFKQQRLLQLRGQKDNPGHHRVNEVPGRLEPLHQIIEGFKHPAPSFTGTGSFRLQTRSNWNGMTFPQQLSLAKPRPTESITPSGYRTA
jgi:hypothetical protein